MSLYRLLISVFVLWQSLRLLAARDFDALSARFGRGAPARSAPCLWWHAASNGELASARPVIDALRAARPDLDLLITCNTRSGVDLAGSWGLAAQLAPFDLGWIVQRFIRRQQIIAHVTMESDIWPNRVLRCLGPVIVLGGRISEKSARGWSRLGGTTPRVLGALTMLCAQDAASLARFRALGLPDRAVGPVVDLKAFYTAPDEQIPDATLRRAFARDATWLAASTHPGEEAVVLAAHRAARQDWPELRLILAPRHPRRADEIKALLEHEGFDYATRSEGGGAARILLADTLGEMALWYQLAGVVFIGGTLTDRGGHTPYEPAAFGAALIHGPDVRNFSAAFARLTAAEAAHRVCDAGSLTRALLALKPPDIQRQQGLDAQAALAQAQDLDSVMTRVLPLLEPAGTAAQNAGQA